MDQRPSVAGAHINIPAGTERTLLSYDGDRGLAPRMSLAIIATQEESSDDGGSQSAVGILHIGHPVPVEFDIRDGVVINLPVGPFSVVVRNENPAERAPVLASWHFMHGPATCENTRSYDLRSETHGPNFRVPLLANGFLFDLAAPAHEDYQALLSDSPTGETYGLARQGVRYQLNQRVRWVRFMDLPPDAHGSIIFFLAI